MIRRAVVPFSVAVVVAAASSLSHAALTASASQATFTAKGPAGVNIVGRSTELSLAESGDELVVTVPLAKLDTGIDLRNRHMRDKYLEVGKYPAAVLKVSKSALTFPKGGPVTSKGTGTLTLHGQSRPTAFTYAAKPAGAGASVSASLRLDMTEFGIEKPGYSGVSVKPEVEVTVTFDVGGA